MRLSWVSEEVDVFAFKHKPALKSSLMESPAGVCQHKIVRLCIESMGDLKSFSLDYQQASNQFYKLSKV